MKLTSVELHPDKSSNVAVLSFRDPASINPYYVKGIDGLDADSIVPKYYAGSGDASFHSLSLQDRQIVVKIGLNPQVGEFNTYSQLRDNLYRMIASSRTGKIQVQFKNGTDVIAALSGFVVKTEAPLFEQMQEVQITIMCDEPMLLGVEETIPLLDLNPTSTTSRLTVVDDKSTAPHGFAFQIKITANLNTLKLIDPDEPNSWYFQIVKDLQPGDVIRGSSKHNDKFLTLFRSSYNWSLIDVVSPGSVWPLLFPGQNEFLWDPDYVQWQYVTYYTAYWGV